MAMKIDSLKLKITSLHSIPFVVVLALAAYPLAGLAHGKGLYSTEAEAQARSAESTGFRRQAPQLDERAVARSD